MGFSYDDGFVKYCWWAMQIQCAPRGGFFLLSLFDTTIWVADGDGIFALWFSFRKDPLMLKILKLVGMKSANKKTFRLVGMRLSSLAGIGV